ncbi:hypothetical protein LPN04_31025 [Rugamonas sp. A1-17]|nr:hypothetical protein [Rugamonas sp. A1-17]
MKITNSIPLSAVAQAAGFELPDGSTTNGWEHVRTLLLMSHSGQQLDDVPPSFWELLLEHLKAKAATAKSMSALRKI